MNKTDALETIEEAWDDVSLSLGEKIIQISTAYYAAGLDISGTSAYIHTTESELNSLLELSEFDDEIIDAIAPWKHCGFVVLTGGEPSLQVDAHLVERLHEAGLFVAMETNGTHAIAEGVDWVTLSPKSCFVDHPLPIVIHRADEVKVIFDGIHLPECPDTIEGNTYLCLQPCDTGDPVVNRQLTAQCVAYIKEHPQWHLSLQTHKMIGIE